MEILLFIWVPAIIGTCLVVWWRDSDFWCTIGIVLISLSAIALVSALIAYPVGYCGIKAEIAQFKQVQVSIDNSRAIQKEIIEQAAIQMQINEWNAWLASTRYWNGTIFDWFIPDEIEKLEPMK